MSGFSLSRSALALSVLALLAGCAEIPVAPTTAAPVGPPPGYWNGDGVPGAAKIVVSLSEQRAYFYKGKNLVGESTVSTGKPGFSTPPGQHRVVWKNPDHISTRFGNYVDDFGNVVKSNVDSRKDRRPSGSHFDGAPMPHAMFFRGGYAMHQGYVPPYAASHGCIRLPREMAEIFYNAAPLGTPVIVKQEAVMRSVTVPTLNPVSTTVAPPAPTLVRSAAPPSIHPAPVRSTAVRSTAPPPVPVLPRPLFPVRPVPFGRPLHLLFALPRPLLAPFARLLRLFPVRPSPFGLPFPLLFVLPRPLPVPFARLLQLFPARRSPFGLPFLLLFALPRPLPAPFALPLRLSPVRPFPFGLPFLLLFALPRLLLFGPRRLPFCHVAPLPFVNLLQFVCLRRLQRPGDSRWERR